MAATYICLPCRQKLARIGFRSSVRGARFISNSNSQLSEQDDPLGFLETGCKSGPERETISAAQILGQGNRPHPRYPIPRPPPINTGDQLESLFESSIKSPDSITSKITSATALASFQNAETLKKMVANKNCSAVNTWDFFLRHFGPDAWANSQINRASTPSYLYARHGGCSGLALLKKIMSAKSQNVTSTPSLTEVLNVYARLDILNGNDCVEMMYVLLGMMLQQPSSEILVDLLGSWNIITCPDGKTKSYIVRDTSHLNWSHIPILSDRNIQIRIRKHGPSGGFAPLLPIKLSFSRHDGIAPLALATFSLLTHHSNSTSEAVRHARPLTNAIARVINTQRLEPDKVLQCLPLDPNVAPVSSYLTSSWNDIKAEAAVFAVPQVKPVLDLSGKAEFIKNLPRLDDALRRRDVGQVDRMWSEMSQFPVYTTTDYGPRGMLSGGVCNHFIQVYMALSHPNQAIKVWNHMVDHGLIPTLATWDSMLTGCKKSRDAKALEDVWAKMHAARVHPDIHCWTSRISGLVECNKSKLALAALDEMGSIWLGRAREIHGMKATTLELQHVKDFPGAVKPAIETINAAIGGLLKRYKNDEAYRVLAWAGNFGITPNVITYNILLRPLIRGGQVQEAMSILRHMKEDGVAPDVATFTTILEETFCYSEQHTPKEQSEILANVFAEMEAAGVKANLHTYGRIIYQLLQSESKDLTAVNAVLARMAQEKLEPSAYIYTIFVEYYFRQNPPDLDAVRGLIQRVRENDDGSADNVFWDRVIEGYAEVGDTAAAMRILGQISSSSARKTGNIGWPTLEVIVGALVKNEEWEAVKDLVRNVKLDSGGPLSGNARGKDGQHKFWRLIDALELLDS